MNILVLGGQGFIGRHAVAALRALKLDPTVGTRGADKPEGKCRQFLLHEMTDPTHWRDAVEEFDVILNCVGILRPVGPSTYDRVHHLAPAAIAQACENHPTRFIHVSALGLKIGDRSRFLTSKLAGEKAIERKTSEWAMVRPSLLDGEGGYGAAWLRGVSALPIFAAPMDAQGKIAALMVTDLGQALARLCTATSQELALQDNRYFDLGGPETFTFVSYLKGLRRRAGKGPNLAIPIPGLAARLGAHLCDLFRLTPFSFGHWELLRKDNAPTINRLPELLQRAPTPVIPTDR
ncbi:MAG: NAD(P)H-binding protein [Lysobacterales bacterium]